MQMVLGNIWILRKEVIQPQVLLRLPCYDFAPVINLTVVAYFLAVSAATSGISDTSLLFLICHLTMVIDGVAVEHVQPCPRNPFSNE